MGSKDVGVSEGRAGRIISIMQSVITYVRNKNISITQGTFIRISEVKCYLPRFNIGLKL